MSVLIQFAILLFAALFGGLSERISNDGLQTIIDYLASLDDMYPQGME